MVGTQIIRVETSLVSEIKDDIWPVVRNVIVLVYNYFREGRTLYTSIMVAEVENQTIIRVY